MAVLAHAAPQAPGAIQGIITTGGQYSTTLQVTVGALLARHGGGVIISANRPSYILKELLAREGIAVGTLQFVDCVSGLTGVQPAPDPQVLNVESPNLLEKIGMRTDLALKRRPGFLVVDSLSSLAVYNGVPAVVEWVHGLVSRLRRSGTPVALMVVERQAGEDLLDHLPLLCDLVITA